MEDGKENANDANVANVVSIAQKVDALKKKRDSRGANHALAGQNETKNFGALLGQSVDERTDTGPKLISRLVAEFVGTFFLVFTVGVSVHTPTGLAPVAIGLMLAIQIYTYGSVSGGMFNPAVTVAVLLAGRNKIKPKNAAYYVVVQFGGATVAGLFAYAVTDSSFCFDWKANKYGGSGVSLLLETFFTSALCSTVLAAGTSYDTPNQYFGFAIGLTVMASAYACGGFDQGSFNPAVTWGINLANIVNSDRKSTCEADTWFLFLLVPFLGSILSAAVFRGTREDEYTLETAPRLLREKLLAEFVGTFFLVFTVGVAATGGGTMAAVAIGVMLGVQIYTFGNVSGACLNPAVTLAVLLSGRGKMSPKDATAYIGTQLVAGVIGGFFAYLGADRTFFFDYIVTEKAGGAGSSFLLEALCTMALCMAVLATGTSRDAPNQYFGFAIGCTVTASAILCGKFDQGSLNPAVTLGINMANYANNRTNNPSAGAWFLFFLTPFLGSAMAAGTFMATRLKEYEVHDGSDPLMDNQDSGGIGRPEIVETE